MSCTRGFCTALVYMKEREYRTAKLTILENVITDVILGDKTSSSKMSLSKLASDGINLHCLFECRKVLEEILLQDFSSISQLIAHQ